MNKNYSPVSLRILLPPTGELMDDDDADNESGSAERRPNGVAPICNFSS